MKNGSLKFDNDFIVDKKFTLQDLKRIETKFNVEPLLIHGIHSSYKTKLLDFEGKKVIPTLYFENGMIARVSIYLSDGRSGWSEDIAREEQQKKAAQDAWLKNILNLIPPYNFNWGKIESLFDPRSCSSSVVVSYVKNSEK